MDNHSRGIGAALAAVVGLIVSASVQGDSQAGATAPALCSAIPSACEYAPPSAPDLGATVCFKQGRPLVLRPAHGCTEGYAAYVVSAGEVIDPMNDEVAAYIRLQSACALGYCVPDNPDDPPGEEGAMCCDPSTGACKETDAICPPKEIAVWCPDGQKPAQAAEGEWECQEV